MQRFEDEPDAVVDDFHRSVRARAANSMDALRDSFQKPAANQHRQSPRSRSPRRNRSSPDLDKSHAGRHHDRGRSWSGLSYSDASYNVAVDRLRGMLSHVERKQRSSLGVVNFRQNVTSPVHGMSGDLRTDLPSIEELVPLLQSQAGYIQQLEGENKYCQNELSSLKVKVLEIVDENRRLHEQLKNTVVDDVLYDVSPPRSPPRNGDSTIDDLLRNSTKKIRVGKWPQELERIRSLYKATNERLEAQVAFAKEELRKHEELVDVLKVKLRNQESLTVLANNGVPSGAPGLCIKCAQTEAVLAASQEGLKSGLVERLEKERDELMDSFTHIKASLESMRQREQEACEQVKQSIELVEEAQLEKTQVIVQKEQLNDELHKMRQRFEELVADNQQKIVKERETVRKECEHELEEYTRRLKEMTEKSAIAETNLDRVTREKVSCLAELAQVKQQMDVYGTDYSKATDNMKGTMAQATTERNIALQDVNKAKQEIERLSRDKNQEISRLTTESGELRRRLKHCEQDLVDSKEECIKITGKMQELDRGLHQVKLSRDNIERGRTDDFKSLTIRAEQREEELKALISNMEAKHSNTISELEEILANQTTVVGKLRDECRRQAEQLDAQSKRHRIGMQQLKTQNQELSFKWEKSQKRLHEVDAEIVKHGRLHEKMRQQLQQMDEHAQHSSQQIIDLLAKQSQLMRDRQLLVKEVEFLRKQISIHNECDADKLYSSHKGLVDDILSEVNSVT